MYTILWRDVGKTRWELLSLAHFYERQDDAQVELSNRIKQNAIAVQTLSLSFKAEYKLVFIPMQWGVTP